MRHPLLHSFVIGAALLLALAAPAKVTLAPLFQDHMVLQREMPVPVWGQAAPGEAITVTFGAQTVHTVAGADQRWLVRLASLTASAKPAELVVTGHNTIRVADVLVGEVWLCSGQSNMAFPVDNPASPLFHLNRVKEEVAAASHPQIRHFRAASIVGLRPAAARPGEQWVVCSPQTVGLFTAVGYFFARDLQQKLGVPIGLINSSWGGTPVEAWMSAEALASDPAFAVVATRWQQILAEYELKKPAAEAAVADWKKAETVAKAAGEEAHALFLKQNRKPRLPHGPNDPWTPTGLFDGMIAPLVPAAFRGVLWYQGENNAERAAEYHALFSTMITQWRQTWGRGNFPFYFVQLANYRAPGDPTGQNYAYLREAQTQTLTLPETGMAVIIDVGNPDDIHPGNKQEVGRRLALIAGANAYQLPGEYSGPVFAQALREKAALRVKFTHADGLTAGARTPTGFVIAGADRVFHEANARIEGDTVVVASPDVPEPVAVRYAWGNNPAQSLANSAGLPAGPFRTDRW